MLTATGGQTRWVGISEALLHQQAGTNTPERGDWHTLLRQMEALVRQYREISQAP